MPHSIIIIILLLLASCSSNSKQIGQDQPLLSMEQLMNELGTQLKGKIIEKTLNIHGKTETIQLKITDSSFLSNFEFLAKKFQVNDPKHSGKWNKNILVKNSNEVIEEYLANSEKNPYQLLKVTKRNKGISSLEIIKIEHELLSDKKYQIFWKLNAELRYEIQTDLQDTSRIRFHYNFR